MFRKNKKHQQPALISAASELPEKQRRFLENSWAGIFYKEFFSRIPEDEFAILYSEKGSRPNIPVNVLIGLETLKSGYGLSDEELYSRYCFDLQIRYALGYDRLGDGSFEIRTLYNFRERLSRYNLEHGVNLIEKAFEQVTDAQIGKLKIGTGLQRMDSTQIASNIVWSSRLQLLVEALQRVERIMKEEDKKRWAETLEPLVQESAGHYTYRIKGKEAQQETLERIGIIIQKVLADLKSGYEEEVAYQVLERIFAEHFSLVGSHVKGKKNEDISPISLQSVDDLEATYRTKGEGHFKGYVTNVSETCDPENKVQLITKIQVAPNHTEDDQLLAEAISDLVERGGLKTIVTDGAYGGSASTPILKEHGVEILTTGIRGKKPTSNTLHLSDFEFQEDSQGIPHSLTCPKGQNVSLTVTHTGRYQARFNSDLCMSCPFQQNGECPTHPQKRKPGFLLTFSTRDMIVAQRRKKYIAHTDDKHNIRSAVEATVRSIKCHFPAGKLPVRGCFRISCMMNSSAAMTNVRRIHRFLVEMKKEKREKPNSNRGLSDTVYFLSSIFMSFGSFFQICLPVRKLGFALLQ